jgi:hypothetical protein
MPVFQTIFFFGIDPRQLRYHFLGRLQEEMGWDSGLVACNARLCFYVVSADDFNDDGISSSRLGAADENPPREHDHFQYLYR